MGLPSRFLSYFKLVKLVYGGVGGGENSLQFLFIFCLALGWTNLSKCLNLGDDKMDECIFENLID